MGTFLTNLKNGTAQFSDELAWRNIVDLSCVGWLTKTESNQWKLQTNLAPKESIELWAITPKPGEAAVNVLTKIGTRLADGSLDIKNETACRIGRPLFSAKKMEK